MTCVAFLARCNAIWVVQGFPDMPGHAFHIGGATELLLQGVNPDIISTQGDGRLTPFWSTDGVLILYYLSSSHLQLILSVC
jgi:hypothetical protein